MNQAQGPTSLPPTIVHSTKSISQSEAHDFLAAYLGRANNDPSLQPNASITEHGPVSRTTTAAPNLILHNLKRVGAGLSGEVLGRDLTVAKQNPGEEYLDVAAGVSNQNEGEEEQGHDLQMAEDGFETEAGAFEEQESLDKDDRKRRKKERRLAEKKARAQKENVSSSESDSE